MSPVIAFVTGLAVTMGIVLLALVYLRGPLQAILTDLCGTVERARFWTAFSNVTLFLVPFALALGHQHAAEGSQSPVFAISDQVESAIIGLIISVVILGIVLSWHISRTRFVQTSTETGRHQSSPQTDAAAI
jgi:hypothetical protein